MKPVTFLAESAIRVIFPFFLKSPYGTGIG
jgi:hypothetical protein